MCGYSFLLSWSCFYRTAAMRVVYKNQESSKANVSWFLFSFYSHISDFLFPSLYFMVCGNHNWLVNGRRLCCGMDILPEKRYAQKGSASISGTFSQNGAGSYK